MAIISARSIVLWLIIACFITETCGFLKYDAKRNRCRARKKLRMIVPVPVETTEKLVSTNPATFTSVTKAVDFTANLVLPTTEVVELDGGGNLATLLFAYTLYQGLFTNGRPGDWILPVFATIFNAKEEQWFLDYKDGFSFEVPPLIEAARCIVFLGFGYIVATTWVAALEGISFYGYATAACLAGPAALLQLARRKPPSRTEFDLAVKMKRDFNDFAQARLVRVQGDKSITATIKSLKNKGAISKLDLDSDANCCRESSIILAFRRQYADYRNDAEVTDKDIRKIVREVVGYKPLDGVYIDLKLLNLRRESRLENKRLVEKANLDRDRLLAELAEVPNEAKGNDSLGSDFIR